MGDIIRTITAGGSEKVAAAGDYVHVKTADRAFHLVFEDENYGKIEVTQGDQVRLKGDLSGFRIENKDTINALNVELIVGFGAFRAGQLVGSIDSVNTIVNPVENKAHVSASLNKGWLYTASAAPLTVVAPASNVNGILIHNAAALSLSALSSVLCGVVANVAAPVGINDPGNIRFCFSMGGSMVHNQLNNTIHIPAGHGVYCISSTTGGAYYTVVLEVL